MIATTVAPEVATIALAIGLAFSLLCYVVTNLSPGGMITPGWIALSAFQDPRQLAVLLALTVLTYFGTKVLQRQVILYGKRLFAAVMMLSVVLSVGMFLAVSLGDWSWVASTQTLGFIVPGLITYQLVRQPARPTLISTGIAGLASYGVLIGGALLGFVATA